MKVLIVDDEQSSRIHIRHLLTEFFPETEICDDAYNVSSAFEVIVLQQPDVVLLDIDLPDGNAFDLLNRFQNVFFNIIFITAYEQYAIRAIKVSALDYLLKPFTTGEFVDALQKALRKETESETNRKFKVLIHNLQNQNQLTKIVLRTSNSIHVVLIDDIVRLQADGAYTAFYLKDRKPIVISRNLKEYDNMLENCGFIRTHQSHLVNSKHIVCFHKSDGGSLGLTDKSMIPVATRFRDKVIRQLEQL